MTTLTGWIVLLILFGIAVFIQSAVRTLGQDIGDGLMREVGLAGGFDDMAFLGTVDLFGGPMGNAVDITVAVLAGYTPVRTAVEKLFVDIEEPEMTALIDSAQPSILMAEHAVEFIVGLSRDAEYQQQKRTEQAYE